MICKNSIFARPAILRDIPSSLLRRGCLNLEAKISPQLPVKLEILGRCPKLDDIPNVPEGHPMSSVDGAGPRGENNDLVAKRYRLGKVVRHEHHGHVKRGRYAQDILMNSNSTRFVDG